MRRALGLAEPRTAVATGVAIIGLAWALTALAALLAPDHSDRAPA